MKRITNERLNRFKRCFKRQSKKLLAKTANHMITLSTNKISQAVYSRLSKQLEEITSSDQKEEIRRFGRNLMLESTTQSSLVTYSENHPQTYDDLIHQNVFEQLNKTVGSYLRCFEIPFNTD